MGISHRIYDNPFLASKVVFCLKSQSATNTFRGLHSRQLKTGRATVTQEAKMHVPINAYLCKWTTSPWLCATRMKSDRRQSMKHALTFSLTHCLVNINFKRIILVTRRFCEKRRSVKTWICKKENFTMGLTNRHVEHMFEPFSAYLQINSMIPQNVMGKVSHLWRSETCQSHCPVFGVCSRRVRCIEWCKNTLMIFFNPKVNIDFEGKENKLAFRQGTSDGKVSYMNFSMTDIGSEVLL